VPEEFFEEKWVRYRFKQEDPVEPGDQLIEASTVHRESIGQMTA